MYSCLMKTPVFSHLSQNLCQNARLFISLQKVYEALDLHIRSNTEPKHRTLNYQLNQSLYQPIRLFIPANSTKTAEYSYSFTCSTNKSEYANLLQKL